MVTAMLAFNFYEFFFYICTIGIRRLVNFMELGNRHNVSGKHMIIAPLGLGGLGKELGLDTKNTVTWIFRANDA